MMCKNFLQVHAGSFFVRFLTVIIIALCYNMGETNDAAEIHVQDR